MSDAQKEAVRNYRKRLSAQGLYRFEVIGHAQDKELIRSLAKRLAENDGQAARLRADMARAVGDEPSRKGGIVSALRRSPLVGAGLDIGREETGGRPVDL